ncbi:type II secretory pathway component PulJ [Hymenobacter luteus]|uniref:Type II secretory pathway component PulJ n=2 Tax=Hymenobacter TaxID=89966 RepID=A0A7W9T1G6_9BACT|nr:type II secretory pathway component PulJ [Hymenobacter latericoloratus]MBB6059696.1 type II secretory pathway component PulJ [Hymenobacter luteus]
MQYVLSVVVALPLAALVGVVAWQGWKALLNWCS